MRFHKDAAGITQCIGMGLVDNIHSKVLSKSDYDMLLLFSDGVTDCLSEDDISVICNTTNRKEVIKKIVQRAIEHDSIASNELYENYSEFKMYIPGGKDNTTAAAFINESNRVEEEKSEER